MRVILGGGLCAALVLCSCGDSQESSPPFDRTLGGTKEGAPVAAGVTDPGILSDPTNYRPTRPPGGSETEAPVDDGSTAASSDAQAQAQAVAQALAEAIGKGEIKTALAMFNAEHVALLDDATQDVMIVTYEKRDLLRRHLEQKLDPLAVERFLVGTLGDVSTTTPHCDLLDSEHASVTPNLGSVLFGPVRPTQAMVLVKAAEEWKFQLDSPLTEEEVAQIVTYNQNVQRAFDQVTNWLASTEEVSEDEVMTALTQALQGQPVGVDEEGIPGETPEGAKEQEDEGDEGNEPEGTP